MALAHTAGDPQQRGVSVRIGHAQPTSTSRATHGLSIVSLCRSDFPWLADHLPHAVVRETRYRTETGAVEHVRLRSRDDLAVLPGLTDRTPSRVRDAVLMALATGIREVDVVLVRAADIDLWDMGNREVRELIDPFLSELPGCVVVFPDISGPVDVGPGTEISAADRVRNILAAVRKLAPGLTERYQIGLIDAIDVDPVEELELLRGLAGSDLAMCRWSGAPGRMRAHGWRSAAAAVGGLLAADGEDVGRGVMGRTIQLPAGRVAGASRWPELILEDEVTLPTRSDDSVVELHMHERRESARVMSEPTFRAPQGEWTLPALRAVKIIHHRLIRAASTFVFRNANEGEAAALAAALQQALRPYAARGLIVGERGQGQPKVTGGVDTIPGETGLHAVVTAQLRPWSQQVIVRVAVRPDSPPVLEVK